MGRHSSALPPSPKVLCAFGATDTPIQLDGGQGQNYQSGQIILKPGKDDEETNWIADFYQSVRSETFRLPQPIHTDSGALVVDGWQGWEYLEGEHKPGRWTEIIEVCINFHSAIAAIPKPAYFERREQNPWVIADKVTFEEMHMSHHPQIAPTVEKLRSCLHPIYQKPQLIHGDFGGNVLFSDQLPPAVIDFSPYWRPVEFAIGVVVADAIVWEGADPSLLDVCEKFDNFTQHLARAELRRIIELDTLRQIYGWDMLKEMEAHMPLIHIICERCK